MQKFFIVSLFIHVIVISLLFSSKRIAIDSVVEVALVETPESLTATDLENESIVTNDSEKVQRAAPEPGPLKVEKKIESKKTALVTGPKSPPPAKILASRDLGINPQYPKLSRMLSEEGKVIVQIKTDGAGHISSVDLLSGSGYSRLDQAALSALSLYQTRAFTPNSIMKISFLFRLK